MGASVSLQSIATPKHAPDVDKLRRSAFSEHYLAGTRPDLVDASVDDVHNFVLETLTPSSARRNQRKDTASGPEDPFVGALTAALARKAQLNGIKLSAQIDEDATDAIESIVEATAPDLSARDKAKIVTNFKEWYEQPVRSADRERALAMKRHIMGSPALVRNANVLQLELNTLPDGERLDLIELRRKRMRDQAAKVLADFQALPDDEAKNSIEQEGSLEMYSEENQLKREAIREDPAVCNLLERWWWGSKVFDDKDHNEFLDLGEYQLFHKRLLKLIPQRASGEEEKGEEEGEAEDTTMAEDFDVDKDASGVVTKESYLYAVFQLADQWTESAELGEYVEFLTTGFKIVFGELMADDAPKIPAGWSSVHELVDEDNAAPAQAVVNWGAPAQSDALDGAEIVDLDTASSGKDEGLRAAEPTPSKKPHRRPRKTTLKLEPEPYPEEPAVPPADPPVVAPRKRVAVIHESGRNLDQIVAACAEAEKAGFVGVIIAGDEAGETPLLSDEKRGASTVSIPVLGVSGDSARSLIKQKWIRMRSYNLLGNARVLTPMQDAKCVELIAEVYRAKLKSDAMADARGRPRRILSEFVVCHFQTKWGDRATFKKKYKSFLLCVLRSLDDDGDARAGFGSEFLAWTTLFAQLCGIQTSSGRLVAFPTATTCFMLDRLGELEPHVAEARNRNVEPTPLQRKIINGKNSFVVGLVFEPTIRKFFASTIRKTLNLRPSDEVYKVAMGAFGALVCDAEADGSTIKVVPVPMLLALLCATHAAAHDPSAMPAPRHDPARAASPEPKPTPTGRFY